MFKEVVANCAEEDSEYKSQHQILNSKIDPVAWQTELERVGQRLRVADGPVPVRWSSAPSAALRRHQWRWPQVADASRPKRQAQRGCKGW